MSEQRFTTLTAETMTPEQRAVAEAIQSGPRGAGLRSSASNGPRRPAPRGPAWIASATARCSGVIVSGVSVLNRCSLMRLVPLMDYGIAAVMPPSTMISVPVM